MFLSLPTVLMADRPEEKAEDDCWIDFLGQPFNICDRQLPPKLPSPDEYQFQECRIQGFRLQLSYAGHPDFDESLLPDAAWQRCIRD